MTHSIIAPSSAAQWRVCPASVMMQAAFPDTKGEAAAEGTLAHEVAAALLTGVQGPDATDEMLEYVNIYVNDVRTHSLPDAELHVEQTLGIPRIHEQSFGTIDAWCCDGQQLIIWDLKYGFKMVKAYMNWQAINYVAGLLEYYPTVTEVTIRIVQPRSFTNDGGIRHWRVSREEINGYIGELSAAAHAALGPNPTCFVGEQCRYCRARHVCDALLQATSDAVDHAHDAMTVCLSNTAASEELRRLQDTIKLLEYRAAAIEEQITVSIKAGEVVPGWTLRTGTGRESFKDDAAIIAMGDLLGKDLRAPQKAITPAQARKKGIDPAVVKKFTAIRTGTKLERNDTSYAKEIFGGK
jgi:hypothetical protein